MWFRQSIKEFLDTSAKLTQCDVIYLTDLENILYVGTKNNNFKIDIPKTINKDLLKLLLETGVNVNNNDPLILKDTVINIFDDIALSPLYKSQIILPIIVDDTIFGSLVFCNRFQSIDENKKFTETTRYFVQEIILNYINQETMLEDVKKLEPDNIFNQEYIDGLQIELSNQKNIFNSNCVIKNFNEKINIQYKELKALLDDDTINKIDELIFLYSNLNTCDNYIAYLIGLRKGLKFNNLI